MGKAFLSHSSKNKKLVEAVAEKLGNRKCIYDKKTFKSGEETFEEITKNLDNTDLFVLFISEESLESKWVKNEIFEAYERLEKDIIKKIYPIIIDVSIKHSDPRIPNWIKEKYNLKYVGTSKKISSMINMTLNKILWEDFPEIGKQKNFFVGRNELIEKLENDYADYDKNIVCFLASGVDKIGRKSLLKFSMVKTNIIENTQEPFLIKLDEEQSIEDLILSLAESGFITQLIKINYKTTRMEEKIKCLVKYINEIQKTDEIIRIDDNGCLVKPNGELVPWFKECIDSIENIFVFAISSKFQLKSEYKYSKISSVKVPPFSVSDRRKMFAGLLATEKLDEIPKGDKVWITDLFKGYPEQIKFAVKILKEVGIEEFKDKTSEIIDYNTTRVLSFFEKFNPEEKELLILLSKLGTISKSHVYDIVNSHETKQIFEKLEISGICEYSGTHREYISLADTMKDYLNRSNFKLKEEFENKIKDFVKNFKEEILQHNKDFDYTAIGFVLKTSLISNIDNGRLVDNILPSYYLKAITTLYKIEKKYKDVIFLSKKILEDEEVLDHHFIHEIRKYLCLALARNRDSDFLGEIQKIKGIEHKFLLGFYNRLIGNNKKALSYFEDVLEENPNFVGAQNEKVGILMSFGEHDRAFELSKKLYENSNKLNAHIIQTYLRCLLKVKKEDLNKIKILLSQLKNINTELGNEMYQRGTIEYLAHIKNDPSAVEEIEKLSEQNPCNHYIVLEMFDICDKFYNIDKMEKAYEKLKVIYSDGKQFLKVIVDRCEIVLDARKRKPVIDKMGLIKNQLPESVYKKLEQIVSKSSKNKKRTKK